MCAAQTHGRAIVLIVLRSKRMEEEEGSPHTNQPKQAGAK